MIKWTMTIALVLFFVLGIAAVDAQVHATLPQFKSGASVMMGVPVDFNILDQRVGAIYDAVESDESHIVWKFTGSTGDWAFVFADGRIVVASTVDLDIAAKDTLTKELNDAMDMLNIVDAGITGEARNNALESVVYYANDPDIYHKIKYAFIGNFDFTLLVPDCMVKRARLNVEGCEKTTYTSGISGQYYYIDDVDVLKCEIDCRGVCLNVPCCRAGYQDITDKMVPGLHKISGRASSQHTMIFEIITSSKPNKEFVLYGPSYIPWVNETSKSMDLQELKKILEGGIESTDNKGL